MAYSNIKDPSVYFQAALYTGTGSSHSVTNDANAGNFKPDWVWIKERSTSGGHKLYDSTRGVQKTLQTQSTGAEATTAQGLTAFNTNGFTVGSDGGHNQNNATYVAWQWKANGGTTSTNTDGSVNTTVQTNTDAGFSIVGYTCPDPITNFTIGHGLGVTPDMFIIKTRDGSRNWGVYHKSLTAPAGKRNLRLNQTNAEATESTFFANIDPTSSVIQLGQNAAVNYQGHNYIAYCFAEKQGYSKFGKYVGNGNANGPFVYTGFKPAFVLVKNASATESWVVYDTARNTFNLTNLKLSPNTNDGENNNSGIGGTAYNNIDILSNGFKCKSNNAATNGNGNTIIYMAFAENPFVAGGIPTTAR